MDAYYGGSGGNVLNNLIYNIGPDRRKSNLIQGYYQIETLRRERQRRLQRGRQLRQPLAQRP